MSDAKNLVSTEPIDNAKPNVSPDLKDILVEGTYFGILIDDGDNPFYFSIILALDETTFVCRAENDMAIPDLTSNKKVRALFDTDDEAITAQIRVRKQSDSGNYIAITLISQVNQFQRRKYFRLRTDNNIQYRILIESTGNTYKGTSIEDISEGGIGLLVYTGTQIEKGLKVKLFVKLSKGEDSLVMTGEIANCVRHNHFLRGYRIGIRFTDIKTQDLQRIIDYIADNKD